MLLILVLQELLWVKRKFVHRFGILRTHAQQSGTQCNGTRTRWLFEHPLWRGAQTVHTPQGLFPRTPGIF
jgi:hypothetical protein